MRERKVSKKKIKENKKNQTLRIKTKRAARRSGKLTKEGKVEVSKSKNPPRVSQKRMATIKKSRY